MDIQIEICDTMAGLVRRKGFLTNPALGSKVLYETTDPNGETGELIVQRQIGPQTAPSNPIGPPTQYSGKFVLVVKN